MLPSNTTLLPMRRTGRMTEQTRSSIALAPGMRRGNRDRTEPSCRGARLRPASEPRLM